jgi:hypothetical protein
MASIFRHAESMSLRKARSRPIDALCVFEDLRADPGLQAVLGDEVDWAREERAPSSSINAPNLTNPMRACGVNST